MSLSQFDMTKVKRVYVEPDFKRKTRMKTFVSLEFDFQIQLKFAFRIWP